MKFKIHSYVKLLSDQFVLKMTMIIYMNYVMSNLCNNIFVIVKLLHHFLRTQAIMSININIDSAE